MFHAMKDFLCIFYLIAIIDSIMCLPFGETWKQVGFDIDGTATGDLFGLSVAISSDGNTIAVGAPNSDNMNRVDAGLVRVFSFNVTSGIWRQVGSDLIGVAAYDRYGYSVDMSADGNSIVIGAYNNSNINGVRSGQVRVYSFNSTSNAWIQVGSDINGEGMSELFGWSVVMSSDGKTIASGAINYVKNGTAAAGSVRIFYYNSTNSNWTQVGFGIDGDGAFDQSGFDIAMSSDGSTIAIGAPLNDNSNRTNSGHVRVYTKNISASGHWAQVGLDINGVAKNDLFGWSVAMSADGKTIAAGAIGNDGNGTDSGNVRVHTINITSDIWEQIGSNIDGEGVGDFSGHDVAISADGKTVAIGARYNSNVNGVNSGHVRVYSMNSTDGRWVQAGLDIDGEAESDLSGFTVAMSADGSTIAIGAPFNKITNGNLAGHVRVYKYEKALTNAPTKSPTKRPTIAPTKPPSKSPTKRPTVAPTKPPSKSPTRLPTKFPTKRPTKQPTIAPTNHPAKSPLKIPTNLLTQRPTSVPTLAPTNCGIFGFNFFCPCRNKCGFWRRLLHLHGC